MHIEKLNRDTMTFDKCSVTVPIESLNQLDIPR
jgi:hypothetical protein